VVVTILNAATTLAFSPRDKLLVSGHDSQVRLWNTETWQEVLSLPDARYPAVFSPDGQWLVTGTAGIDQDRRRDPAINPDGNTNAVSDPDGNSYAGGGYLVWNTQTWALKRFCPGEPAFQEQSRHGVAFSTDGKLLVTAGHPGGREVAQFQVRDFPSLTVLTNFTSFPFIPFTFKSAIFTPDGGQLVIGGSVGELMFWDVAEGRVVETRHEHTGAINAITYARDGRTFATASSDRTVILWDAATRTNLVRLRGHLEEVSSVALSPNGGDLASGSREGVTKLWDATTRHDQHMLQGSGIITGFSADGRQLVVGGFTNYRVWQVSGVAPTTIPLDPATFKFRGLDTWSDAHGLEPYAVFGMTNGFMEYWNLATMVRETSWRVHDTGVSTATLSPDGQSVATSDAKGDLKLWDVATHREVKSFSSLGERLVCVIFSSDGRLLAGLTGDLSRVCVWDVQQGQSVIVFDQRKHHAQSLAFSPDGKLLATAHWDNTARLWEIPSGTLKATLKGHVQEVMGVAFSPDGRTLATGGDDGKIKLWNIATEQEMATLEFPIGGCRTIRFSPDGRTLASGSFLGSRPYMWLWQAPSFEEIRAAEAKVKVEIQRP